MDSPIKVFILGSCVSRDPFELADKRDFSVVGYYARSSFASLGAEPFLDEKILLEIKSNWQRRMVRADMEKSLFSDLGNSDFDVLLVDLIDERFSLSIKGTSVHTISTEYKKALYKPNKYSFIKAGSEEKLTLWLNGLQKISKFLIEKNLDNKVLVNRVYWSLRCKHPEKLLSRYTPEQLKQSNEQLEWMYEEIKKALPRARFITYTEEELEVDEQHKWGIDPFHYSELAFIKQLSSIYNLSLRDLTFTLKHKLGDKIVSFPIDWKLDPFSNRSWMHNFMSLRWLNGSYSFAFKRAILVDFYKFHCEKKAKNPYYNGLRGDHTAAIRLNVLIKIKNEYALHKDKSIKNVTHRLILEEIKNLQNSTMYRLGHNHGLMVDLALLNLLLSCPEYKSKIDLRLILDRSAKTLDLMWHTSGLTKEHSVSYQEYNLPLTSEYFSLLEKLKIKSLSSINLRSVISESKRFLGFALKENGEYFPLGDSFRQPNEKILNGVFGDGSIKRPHELLLPYSKEEGTYCNGNFFIFRRTVNERNIHFVATCCWDSHNHKQNDELSFCLEVDGVSIFDDPGYTEFSSWTTLEKLKSEDVHTTLTTLGKCWSEKERTNGKSYLSAYETSNGFFLKMTAERVSGLTFEREILLEGRSLSIKDSIVFNSERKDLIEDIFKSRFTLSHGIELAPSDTDLKKIRLTKGGIQLSEVSCFFDVESFRVETVPYVCSDRTQVIDTKSLVFEFKTSVNPFLYNIVWD